MGCPENRQIVQVDRAQVPLHDRPCDGPRCGIAPARPQGVQALLPAGPANDINHHVKAARLWRGIAVKNGRAGGAQHPGLFRSGLPRHGSAAQNSKLNGRQPDATRGAGHQHAFPRHDPGPRQKIGCRAIGAGHRPDFHIRQGRPAHIMQMTRRHHAILGEGAVIFGPDRHKMQRVLRRRLGLVRRADHPCADGKVIDPRPKGHDPSAQIGPLDARKGQRPCPACGLLRAVPADARVDVGGIHPRRQDPDQHLARSRLRHRQIVAPDQRLRPAMADQLHAGHGGRTRHALILPAAAPCIGGAAGVSHPRTPVGYFRE